MKKFKLLILFILFIVFSINAQITKDSIPTELSMYDGIHMVKEYTSSSITGFNTVGFNSDEVIAKFFIFKSGNDSQTGIITFYNLDYSIYKSLNISIPIGFTGISEITFATTYVFNTDELIEFVVEFRNASRTIFTYTLMNENGDVIYDFKNDAPFNVFNENGDLKLYACHSVGISTIGSIYTLRSSKLNQISAPKIKSSLSPFPNPANQIINLPYQLEFGSKATMKIFDVNGKQIATKKIDSTFDKIRLDVSGYSKGMYVYEYNGKSGKFLVE